MRTSLLGGGTWCAHRCHYQHCHAALLFYQTSFFLPLMQFVFAFPSVSSLFSFSLSLSLYIPSFLLSFYHVRAHSRHGHAGGFYLTFCSDTGQPMLVCTGIVVTSLQWVHQTETRSLIRPVYMTYPKPDSKLRDILRCSRELCILLLLLLWCCKYVTAVTLSPPLFFIFWGSTSVFLYLCHFGGMGVSLLHR